MGESAPRSRQPKPLAAGVFQPDIISFRLCLAAEGKAAKTVQMYTEAVRWFAAEYLIPATSWTGWEQVSGRDIQRWMVWLLDRYSDSYASNQYRRCSSSSSGGPSRRSFLTQWPGSARSG